MKQQNLLLMLVIMFHSTLAQLSPIQPPTKSPPAPTLPQPPAASPPPGMSTVPLVPATPNAAPKPAVHRAPTTDVEAILTKAKRFSVLVRLLKSTQLINQLHSTLHCKLWRTNPFRPRRSLFCKTKSSQVSMTTGAVNASVTGTVYTDKKLAIYQVDKVLLPLDLVLPHKAPAQAPALTSAKGDLPKTDDDKTKPSAADQSGSKDDSSKSEDGEASAVTVDASCSMNLSLSKVVALVLGMFLEWLLWLDKP
ncbi:hypothetical protein L6164_028967 [Bauhinia variegata]|uniref:Uncharacterized protein n=1 Tax=Bauhinia variegata TaxID=167791 RepID=A0ACB9L870_BAUVA|nr:hypothetical protein L6164_028967 [Bauhinia variegata]